jgi:hypothetical protein
MKVRVTFKAVYLHSYPPDQSKSLEDIYWLSAESMSYLVFTVDGQPVPWYVDPEHRSIAVVEIPTLDIEETHSFRVQAKYTRRVFTAYSDGYSNAYLAHQGSGYSHGYGFAYQHRLNQFPYETVYDNLFETYGYDLGNNGFNVLDNPDFTIYMVLNQGPYSCGYSAGYKLHNDTYSNAIAYRKPFTDLLYFYDNTSSTFEDIKWDVYEKPLEIKESIRTRNGYTCDAANIKLTVTKNKETAWTIDENHRYVHNRPYIDSIPRYVEPECCSCGCGRVYVRAYCEYFKHENIATPAIKKDFGSFDLLFTGICSDDCAITKTLSTATAAMDYHLDLYNRDDHKVYSYSDDTLVYKLVNNSGNVIDSKAVLVKDFNLFDIYKEAYEFHTPEHGDYLVHLDILSHSYSNKLIRKCEGIVRFNSKNWVHYSQQTCNIFSFENCSFDIATVTVEKMASKKKSYVFEKTAEYKVDKRATAEIQINEDGVYRFGIKRENEALVNYFVEPVYCNLQKCVKKIMDDLICNPPCDSRYKHDFQSLNVIVPLAYLFVQKLHAIHVKDYIFTAIDTATMQELYTLVDLQSKLDIYCNACEGLNITDCGC